MNIKSAELAIKYGRYLIEQATGVKCQVDATVDFTPWVVRLFDESELTPLPLRSLWTMVSGQEGRRPYVGLLSPENVTLEQSEEGVWSQVPRPQIANFSEISKTTGEAFVGQLDGKASDFEHFYGLMSKYAPNLPCTYGEAGVSLFQQWRMVTAIMALSKDGDPVRLPDQLALIGLDLPGIQESVYTIASRGAGKSVRGRSAFVQILVNAIVDRMVYDLRLCRANVIVNAGGNALILAGWCETIASELDKLNREVNELLLFGNDARAFAGFHGDLALALAWVKLPWSALKYPCETTVDEGTPVSRWQFYEKQVKVKLQQAKLRPFAPLLADEKGFGQLFDIEPIDSNRYCAVCRCPENRSIGEFERYDDEEAENFGAAQVVCPLCKSFHGLANDIAKQGEYLYRIRQPVTKDRAVWQHGLHAISGGYCYQFLKHPPADTADALCLALSPDGFPTPSAHGFWPLATTTPLLTAEDVKTLRQRGEQNPKEGDIRDNAILAEASPGTFKRLGVLKADVDDLGSLLVSGLREQRSAALTATLSESLTLFFGGWLDKICAEEPFHNHVYVLYAGGDDLLILGTWHLIPALAARIAADFVLYTGKNPGVHLSAGISIIGGKEPLYAAVEAANSALKQAKRYPIPRNATKNAIGFLGRVVDWNDFADIQGWRHTLDELIKQGAPKSLLMTLLQIYTQYEDDHRAPQEKTSGYATRAREGMYDGNSLYLGPWLWQMIYRLYRLSNPVLTKETIQEIQQALLQNYGEHKASGVEKLALSARWTQLLGREK